MAVCQELTLKSRSSIGYDGPPTLPHVRISSTELMQVLINVVAERGPGGHGARRAERQGRDHRARGCRHARAADSRQRNRDAAEVLRKAGTPFFTTRAEGTGLGIAQCQRLIGTAGGRFRIESEQGAGTTVTIMLPTT